MKKFLLAMMLAACSSAYAAEVYTCTANGKTVYQGKPCAGSKEQISKIREKQNNYRENESRKSKAEAEWNSKKEPSVGMTTTQVGNSTWGYPQKYSETQTAYGNSEFWHYGSGRMIHFRNGVVVALTK